jgi:hypothetical protein
MTVLNVNAGGAKVGTGILSRGSIIPQLLPCDSLREAVVQAAGLDPANYAPFRLVLADRGSWAEVRSDGQHMRHSQPAEFTKPLLFTSSGLGDDVVEGPRRRLFEEVFARRSDPTALQNLFHCHRWPDRPHLSVNMSRDDACTVSRAIVGIDAERVALTYHAIAQGRPTDVFSACLDLLSGVVR